MSTGGIVNAGLAGLGVEFLAGDGTSFFRVCEESAKGAGFGALMAPWLGIVTLGPLLSAIVTGLGSLTALAFSIVIVVLAVAEGQRRARVLIVSVAGCGGLHRSPLQNRHLRRIRSESAIAFELHLGCRG